MKKLISKSARTKFVLLHVLNDLLSGKLNSSGLYSHFALIASQFCTNFYRDYTNNYGLSEYRHSRFAQLEVLLSAFISVFPYAYTVQIHTRLFFQSKEFEIHLQIGESLVLCAEGVNSNENRDPWVDLPKEVRNNHFNLIAYKVQYWK